MTKPTVSLILCTLGRTDCLVRLLESLEAQHCKDFELVVVDQNPPGLLDGWLDKARERLDVVYLRSQPGLSRSRNVGVAQARGSLLAFPDDDCWYPPTLLEEIIARFSRDPALSVLTCRTRDAAGRDSNGVFLQESTAVSRSNVWKAGNSNGLFVRTALARRLGGFDEELGLGSGTPFGSGEESDFLLRALSIGAVVRYLHTIHTHHDQVDLVLDDKALQRARKYARGFGRTLRLNRFAWPFAAARAVRSAAAAMLAVVTLRPRRALLKCIWASGILAGYLATPLSRSDRRRVLYAGLRFQHHQYGSGYDLVAPPDAAHVRAESVPLLGSRPDGSLPRKLALVLADVVTLLRGLRHDVVHYYYPEDTAFFSARLLSWMGKRIVLTIHLDDAAWLHGRGMGRTFSLKQAVMRCADVIITLSTAQRDRFQAHFPDKLVTFVPHGFQPLTEAIPADQLLRRQHDARLLVIGENYRDFDLLARIIDQRSGRAVRFHLIGVGETARRRFSGLPSVVVHPRLSDKAYSDLLDGSFALLLPLSFATANNALLEAHKWALPSFCPDIDGARDYATRQTELFTDAADFWQRFDRLARATPHAYVARCRDLTEDAGMRFQWSSVRSSLSQVYRADTATSVAR